MKEYERSYLDIYPLSHAAFTNAFTNVPPIMQLGLNQHSLCCPFALQIRLILSKHWNGGKTPNTVNMKCPSKKIQDIFIQEETLSAVIAA